MTLKAFNGCHKLIYIKNVEAIYKVINQFNDTLAVKFYCK